MSDQTTIEWTDATWSPIRVRRKDTGKVGQHCERVSPGCTHCYAARHNGRNLPNGGTGLDYARASRDLVEAFVDERVLVQPLRWRTSKRIFVQNQTDFFGEWVTDEQRDRVFAAMALAPQHTFQVLTKRPERMRAYVCGDRYPIIDIASKLRSDSVRGMAGALAGRVAGRITRAYLESKEWPIPNIWFGVTAEDQQRADERIPILLDTPAAVRFLSCEPLLCDIDLGGMQFGKVVNGIDWVIVGGESGPGARECNVAWIRSIVSQCRAAKVPVFVKQLGAFVVDRNDRGCDGDRPDEWPTGTEFEDDGSPVYQGKLIRVRLNDRKGGSMDEWPEDLRVRQFPREAVRT